MKDKVCPFCRPDPKRIFYRGQLVLGLWDAFPVNPGHALLVPVRHVASWFDATDAERAELIAAVEIARDAILAKYKPDGFNIGVNVDTAAGQTVFHVHLHVIPRYSGDVEDPTGGVRNVVPERGNYLLKSSHRSDKISESQPVYWITDRLSPPHADPLICGETDPLLPHLLTHLDAADRADFAVSFVLESGTRLLLPHLQDLLDRGGRLRLLTSDYLGVTDPHALMRLLDLQGQNSYAAELRIFQCWGSHFHPKAYIFHGCFGAPGNGIAYVGSSNLSGPALQEGIEWNYRVYAERPGSTWAKADSTGFETIVKAFDKLFCHPMTVPLSRDWIEQYRKRRPKVVVPTPVAVPHEQPLPPPEPHELQRKALDALKGTRAQGNQAGLVVLATGLGKTWLAAFDTSDFGAKRVLFVAHREEILRQARDTFRRIRPEASLGFYTGQDKAPDAEVIFASIQTLGRVNHLRRFGPQDFDYIVVDEFHHAAARSYRKLIDYFEPAFLLGLTATPERTDGGNLLALCGENLVFRCDLVEGIRRELLCPFHYFGVPDDVDYSNIPWRSGRFDETALTQAVATRKRAQNALEQYRARAGKQTLAFCCSQSHADFMADFFRRQGIAAAAVHTGERSSPRARSLEQLRDGELDVIFAVDIFNEGVDLPNVDTILMLRPTESRILWTQQFGRGLRIAQGKEGLSVIDYIGNHRTFLMKPQTLLGLPPGDQILAQALDQLEQGTWDFPPGCEITYELESINILRSLIRPPSREDALRIWYEDFRDQQGERPRAAEAMHAGYAPRAARRTYGSWIRFVHAMGDLPSPAKALLEDPTIGAFLDHVEITQMTKSFKMLTLQAMLAADSMPGEMSGEELTKSFARIARRSASLRSEVEVDLGDPTALGQYLERNPINAWTGDRGRRRGTYYFTYKRKVFKTTFNVPKERRELFQRLVGEIVEWRLAEYLGRPSKNTSDPGTFICKVSHANRQPILFLPDRSFNPNLPSGWTAVVADGELYEANFVKVAVNVMRRKGSKKNELHDLMRGWFGPNAGLPGTNFQVVLRKSGVGYALEPMVASGSNGVNQ